jgi:murein DD-endopeptidase MepM/ murein hydrolase activator NlpD
MVNDMMEEVNFEEFAETAEFHMVITNEDNLSSVTSVADSLVERTSTIEKGTRVTVNGKTVAYVEAVFGAKDYVKNYLDNYIEDKDYVSTFVAPVEFIDGYFLKNDFVAFDIFEALIKSLDVQSVKTVKEEKEMKFSTIKKRDDTLSVGQTKLLSKGVKGLKYEVTEFIKLNGEDVKTEYVGDEIAREPVSEVILVGNRGNYIRASWIETLDAIWPLQKVKGQNISAYWGDERNHKGLDIASAYGTEIFAAQSGTVIEAEYDDGYGYHVVIEHNGEFKTLYGHASLLCVEKGQKVAQGDVIAFVGSTGMSTGNHLHFEVIRKGEKLDPFYFLGL